MNETLVKAKSSEALSTEDLKRMDAYWRAANYISVGQIYCSPIPSSRSRCGPGTSSRAFSGIGAPHPALTSCLKSAIGSGLTEVPWQR